MGLLKRERAPCSASGPGGGGTDHLKEGGREGERESKVRNRIFLGSHPNLHISSASLSIQEAIFCWPLFQGILSVVAWAVPLWREGEWGERENGRGGGGEMVVLQLSSLDWKSESPAAVEREQREVPLQTRASCDHCHYQSSSEKLWTNGARVPNVWGRVPNVWVQGSKCMGPGFQMYEARVPNVWGRVPNVWVQGSKCMRPGFQMYGSRVQNVWGRVPNTP